MARLGAIFLVSLDGFMADEDGDFSWAAPDEEVHEFVNDLSRGVGTHLYGRHMYQVMSAWETMPVEGEPPAIADFAQIWRAAEKVVFSTTLDQPSTERTQIQRRFDPEQIRTFLATTDRDALIGGPTLAAQAAAAGLVDDWHLLVMPVLVGAGLRALPEGVRQDLRLVSSRAFASGAVHLHHARR